MTIRLILVLTVFALVLGGVGAAFVQAQPNDSGSPVAPEPRRRADPTDARPQGVQTREGVRQERRPP